MIPRRESLSKSVSLPLAATDKQRASSSDRPTVGSAASVMKNVTLTSVLPLFAPDLWLYRGNARAAAQPEANTCDLGQTTCNEKLEGERGRWSGRRIRKHLSCRHAV